VSTDASKFARVTVSFPIAVWRAVERMAEDLGISKTEALRRCVSTEVFRRQVEAEGAHLVVRGADGADQRVHFPY
jgi:hypothetical protein